MNVAGLLLVRAIRRRREYAVRLALGARSGRILRETIFEGLILSCSGGLLGLALAAVAIRTALHLLPDSMPRIDSISIDAGVAAFAFAVALLSGVVSSLAPAFAVLRTNVSQSLKEGGSSGTAAADAELGVDPPDVVLHGLLGQEQASGDLPVGLTVRDERHDLHLARG